LKHKFARPLLSGLEALLANKNVCAPEDLWMAPETPVKLSFFWNQKKKKKKEEGSQPLFNLRRP
jgi:hypothetical protein